MSIFLIEKINHWKSTVPYYLQLISNKVVYIRINLKKGEISIFWTETQL